MFLHRAGKQSRFINKHFTLCKTLMQIKLMFVWYIFQDFPNTVTTVSTGIVFPVLRASTQINFPLFIDCLFYSPSRSSAYLGARWIFSDICDHYDLKIHQTSAKQAGK